MCIYIYIHIYVYEFRHLFTRLYGCVRLSLPSQRSAKSFVTHGAKIGFASSGDPV